MPTYTATWPGVSSIRSFSFPFSPGVRPSTCVLTTHITQAPPVNLAQFGTLTIPLNSGGGPQPVLEFPDCLLESPRIPESDPTMIQLPIRDRRWRWRFGMIRGSYNVRQPNNTYLRERTPQQLATLCLDAMGEANYDISRLPNSARLPRKWIAENPAQELDKICRELGCVVVLNPSTNIVELWPVGSSRNPDPLQDSTYQISDGDGITVSAKPKDIVVYGGETLFQSVFQLGEAVGRDTDGTLKPINQLSYTPPGGWGTEGPELFSFQFDDTKYIDPFSGEQKMVRDLALGSVWKMYRIGELVQGGFQPVLLAGDPNFGPQFLSDLNLRPYKLDRYIGASGKAVQIPSRVIGFHYIDTLNGEDDNFAGELHVGFTISNEEGVVIFSEPVYRYGFQGETIPADLWLECSFTAGRNGNTHRYRRSQQIDPNGGGERPLMHRELIRESIERFEFDPVQGPLAVGLSDNVLELHTDADNFIQGAANEYQPRISRTLSKWGIHSVSPDGNIVQVSWSKSGSSTTSTVLSSARQHNPYQPSVEDQRREQQAQEQADKQQAVDQVVAEVLG